MYFARKLYFFEILLMFVLQVYSQTGNSGFISGKIVDKDTRETLAGANIVVMKTALGAATAGNGEYVINQLSPGHYSLEFSYIGYMSLIKTYLKNPITFMIKPIVMHI